MQTRHLTELKDKRLTERGNLLLNRLFAIGGQSIRQLATNDSQAKGFYRFLTNENVSEQDIIRNMVANCRACVADRPLLCLQDSSEINLANHRNRLKKDDSLGLTDGSEFGLGFFIHPSCLYANIWRILIRSFYFGYRSSLATDSCQSIYHYHWSDRKCSCKNLHNGYMQQICWIHQSPCFERIDYAWYG